MLDFHRDFCLHSGYVWRQLDVVSPLSPVGFSSNSEVVLMQEVAAPPRPLTSLLQMSQGLKSSPSVGRAK